MGIFTIDKNNINVMRKSNSTPAPKSNRPSQYNKLSYTQKIARINRKLRVGDISNVAAATGYTSTSVSDTLSGKYVNETIVNRAYDVTRGRMSNSTKLANSN